MLKNLKVEQSRLSKVSFTASGGGNVSIRTIEDESRTLKGSVEIVNGDRYATFKKEDLLDYIDWLQKFYDQM